MEFEAIYRRYYKDVYYFVLSLCGNPDTAEELTQETFFRALKSIDRFRGDCQLKSWLCQIGKNVYLSQMNRKKYLAGFENPEQLMDRQADIAANTVEEQFLQKDAALSVYKVLHRLPEPYKEVFSLRTLGELSYREIGEIFGRGEGWARVTYHRAKLKIRDILGEVLKA